MLNCRTELGPYVNDICKNAITEQCKFLYYATSGLKVECQRMEIEWSFYSLENRFGVTETLVELTMN